jgi:cyclopropane fatty-acyl-phospholipid synthase-like methyltransferase
MNHSATSRTFFEEKYKGNEDPWEFASSPYELARYDAIIQALSFRRYRRAFEPACSIGVLTEQLATLCDRVDAIDISSTAVEQAVQRCRQFTNVSIKQGALPPDIPAGKFDLIVFSEVGYYFTKPQLRSLIDQLMSSLESESIFLAAHWLGSSPDHILDGNEVHEIVSSTKGLIHDHAEHHPGFRLDRWICQ